MSSTRYYWLFMWKTGCFGVTERDTFSVCSIRMTVQFVVNAECLCYVMLVWHPVKTGFFLMSTSSVINTFFVLVSVSILQLITFCKNDSLQMRVCGLYISVFDFDGEKVKRTDVLYTRSWIPLDSIPRILSYSELLIRLVTIFFDVGKDPYLLICVFL